MNIRKQIIAKTLADNSGFGLIEALISISIFSIGFLALMAVILSSSNLTRRTVLSDWSVMAGQEMVEMMSIVDIEHALLANGNHQPVLVNENAEYAQIDMEWDIIDITDPDNDGMDDFKTIAISVESDDELRLQSFYRRTIN